jgi:hypothetical protein
MSHRHIVIMITIAIVLTLQFIVPVIQYPLDGANRWGWQMYSRENPRPGIVAVLEDGDRQDIRFGDHVYSVRAELRLSEPVLLQLCERVPEAAGFELISRSTGELKAEFPCDR